MDGRRFDEFTRASATRANRRQVFRAFLGTMLGGIGVGRRVRHTSAQDATTCLQDSDCADGVTDPCSGASCDSGICTFFIVSCIPGFVCCGNGACCPATAACQSDIDCAEAADDPCTGARCENGVCVPYILTCAAGFDCCKGICAVTCYDGAAGGA